MRLGGTEKFGPAEKQKSSMDEYTERWALYEIQLHYICRRKCY